MADPRNINISSLAVPVKAAFAAMRLVSLAFSTFTSFASNLQYPYTGFEHIVAVAMEGLLGIGVVPSRDHQVATNALRTEQPPPANSYLRNDETIPPWTSTGTTSSPSSLPFPRA